MGDHARTHASLLYAGIQRIKFPWAETSQASANVHHQIAGRLQPERGRTGIFNERGIVLIIDSWRNHDFDALQNFALQVLGQQPLVLKLEMWPMLFRCGTDWNKDDCIGTQDRLGLLPRQVFK